MQFFYTYTFMRHRLFTTGTLAKVGFYESLVWMRCAITCSVVSILMRASVLDVEIIPIEIRIQRYHWHPTTKGYVVYDHSPPSVTQPGPFAITFTS